VGVKTTENKIHWPRCRYLIESPMPRMMSMSPVYPHRIIRSKAGNDTFGTRTSHQGFFLPISLWFLTKYHICENSGRIFGKRHNNRSVVKEMYAYLPYTEISTTQNPPPPHLKLHIGQRDMTYPETGNSQGSGTMEHSRIRIQEQSRIRNKEH
jgi:hypothetical protein